MDPPTSSGSLGALEQSRFSSLDTPLPGIRSPRLTGKTGGVKKKTGALEKKKWAFHLLKGKAKIFSIPERKNWESPPS